MTKQWTAGSLQELLRSHQLPFIVLVLLRRGVFDRLIEAPATAQDMAQACGVDEGALIRLLNVITSVGILQHREGTYSLAPELAAELTTDIGSPLDAFKHAAEGLDKWVELETVLERGFADYAYDRDVTRDPARNENFIRAMHAHSGPMARRFAELVPRGGAMTFLDVGGGPGTFCHALLDAWTDLKATIADLPLTLRVARTLVAEKGLADRLSLIEADFFLDRKSNLGGPYDLILVSAVIHAEAEVPCRDLFERLHAVTSPGGRIVVRERILDEDRTGPPPATMFDAHMLVSTRRGRCYSLSEISSMLTGAGFRNPRLLSDLDEGFVIADA
ncbi:MAG: methyltransferase domain-containing protein [Deltaproteobacteria bacterium]|nr:methyltransferase domain-containing protein [Deltaproteobacteria bacterium]